MGIEYHLPWGMLIRKMYCSRCGTLLKRKEIRKTYKRGEPGFRNQLSTRGLINVSTYTTVSYVYHCYGCGNEISYDDQVKVAKIQSKRGTRILEDETK